MSSNRRLIRLKYRIAWYIGTILSFLLYLSGIIALYMYFRRRYLKENIAFVLMYHRVSDRINDPDVTVSDKNFERQMSYLKKNFNVVSLDDMVDRYKQNTKSEKDTVAITFDDGFKDNYTDAYPILKKYNIPATIFIVTGYIDRNYGLSKDEIITMQKDNITFGAHTMTHRVLLELDKRDAFLEINDSKSVLEKILNEKVKYFAYPYGKKGRDFTDKSMQIVKEAGYNAAFSTENGYINSKNNLFALNRIGMRNFPLFVFKGRVSGIFENRWFHILRRLVGI